MLYIVEIRRERETLAQVMSAVREWLDAQRFEPDAFRCKMDDAEPATSGLRLRARLGPAPGLLVVN